ncbi:CHAT domain-containing protein [Fodinibius salinus]|uniref:CHAT domain-containing protein n=1 Tax=Fodinibius salinus TaxID=860790 RepID=A0A5D3YLX4_9BACT|nr:CHAT domain-containing protein [Fodinibius salinus]TYP93681.1 CHAT domain-containing protein [Fodinibius salinus]
MNRLQFFLPFTLFLLIPLSGMSQSLQLADSLYQTGREFDKNGKMQQSEFYYHEAYNMYREFQDTASWLKAGKEYASAMMWRSKNEQALTLYQKLLAVDHPANDAYNRGDLYNSMGLASRRKGNLDQANRYYQESLPFSKKSGDSLLIGVVYSNIGKVQQARGHYSKAMQRFKQSLPYLRGINQNRNFATSLSNISSIYEELSLFDKALEYVNRSLEIHKENGNVYELCSSYNQLGSVQQSLGNYDQALISYNKSLDYSHKAGTPKQTASTLNGIGLLYKRLGKYDKALDYYRQSLTIKKETGNPGSVATTTNNLGQLLWDQEKYDEADKYFHKALALRKKIGNPYKIYYSLNAMAGMYLVKQEYEEAKSYVDQIKAIGDSTDNYNMLKTASTYLGRITSASGNNQLAIHHFQKAYAYSKYLSTGDQLPPLKKLAKEYHKINSDSALFYGEKAINIVEKKRSNAGALSELKSGFFGQHTDFYTEMASWMLTYTQDLSRAYKLVEQAKARSLSDELAQASQNIDQKLPEKVRVERREKQNQIDRLYTKLENADNSKQRSNIEDKIRSKELNYAAYENELHQKYPELKSLQSPEPISLQRAQSLTDDQTAVLEYAVAENQLITFLITPNEIRAEQVSLSGDEPLGEQLTSLVGDFKSAILSNAPRSQLRSQSAKLYSSLIKPFEKNLKRISNLIIVPDGALAYLPFEALSRGDQYLIERFNIKYEPSLTSLNLLKESETPDRQGLLAVAGSNFSEQNSRQRSFQQSNLSGLPSTLMEVDSIATKFKEAAILKEDEVSEQRFKEMLEKNRYRYIHMATHGIIDENNPSRSGLTLSAKRKITASSKEDGMLRSSEIFGLDIDSDMVVLSACNTGLGKVVKGEGILGMQRSFFYAGTSTVVVSLWNVYDRSTASFMNEFYKALVNSKPQESWTDSMLRWVGWNESIPFGQKASAMRQAKLKMIKHPLFNHPVYWAPFIVVGR